MKNKNLYAGVAAGFVSGKVVKSFAYSLVPVAAIGYVVMHAPEILAKLGFEKYAVMIEVWPRVRGSHTSDGPSKTHRSSTPNLWKRRRSSRRS